MLRAIVAALCIGLLGAAPVRSPSVATADAAFASGDFATAAAGYDVAARQAVDDPAAHYGRARMALYRNDLDTADREAAAVLRLDPSNEAASRLRAQIAARRDASLPASLPPGEDAITVPFAQVDPLPLVPVRANGVKAFFIIDTGAPNVVLDPAFARKIGVAVTPLSPAGGKAATGSLAIFQIGEVAAGDVPISIAPTRRLRGFAQRVDGIVGMGFLMHYTTTLDYGGKALVLRARSQDVSASLAAQAASNDQVSVPFWLVGDHFVFARGQIGSAPESLLLVDTGLAGGGVMPTQATIDAAQLQLQSGKPAYGSGRGATVVPLVAPEVSLGTFQRQNVEGFFDPQGAALARFPFAVGGIVSHKFFQPGSLTYDFVAMRLYLTP